MTEDKKYYWASAIIIRKSALAGMPKVAPSTMVLDHHPLIHELQGRKKDIAYQWQNWIEISKEIYETYYNEMKKDAGKARVLHAIGNVDKSKPNK